MKQINIDQLPTLDTILTGNVIEDFRKTITEVLRSSNRANISNITRKLLFTLSVMEDIREEYADVLEKEIE